MARRRGDIGRKRRAEIVEAAVAIIAEKGLHRLSLSALEKRAGMSRGQLTYYYAAKEDILLAVFDHTLETMRSRKKAGEGPPGLRLPETGWPRLRAFLSFFVLTPPDMPEFHALQYAFLSEASHRDDYRQRLAALYEEWRAGLARDMTEGMEPPDARVFSTLVQAILHGLAMQRFADPSAFDAQKMLDLTLDLLSGRTGKPAAREAKKTRKKKEKP
ncbi:MAG: TetR/AcrR family transcriptional regulator [Gemmataceae bacterium]|nr:TetR/AcrR family transcriptional regulator [Gemmataceae bacterium]